jgi:hypothetical protein
MHKKYFLCKKCSGLTNTWLALLFFPGNREKYKFFEDTKPGYQKWQRASRKQCRATVSLIRFMYKIVLVQNVQCKSYHEKRRPLETPLTSALSSFYLIVLHYFFLFFLSALSFSLFSWKSVTKDDVPKLSETPFTWPLSFNWSLLGQKWRRHKYTVLLCQRRAEKNAPKRLINPQDQKFSVFFILICRWLWCCCLFCLNKSMTSFYFKLKNFRGRRFIDVNTTASKNQLTSTY